MPSPSAWLSSPLGAVCVLDWTTNLRALFREVPEIRCSTPALATYLRRRLDEQIQAQERAVAAQQDLSDTAEIRYESGVSIYLEVLDALYGAKLSPKAMAAETQFAGISLEGDPGHMEGGPVKIKLFFEKGGADRYAELLCEIGTINRGSDVRCQDRSDILKNLELPR